MMAEADIVRATCHGCGALVPAVEGPTHRYIGAVPGCWAIYGEVLAREYSDLRYWRAHRLTVDAYAAQHPGIPSPQSIQSVAVHLLALHAVFERGVPLLETVSVLQKAAMLKQHFTWLTPPSFVGTRTILDVHRAGDAGQHAQLVQDWARSVWNAWTPHHRTIGRWAAL